MNAVILGQNGSKEVTPRWVSRPNPRCFKTYGATLSFPHANLMLMNKSSLLSAGSVSSSRRVRRPATRRLLAAACATALMTVGAQGQSTITVTSFANDGVGSLREAIGLAEAGDTIRFQTAGTIQLTEQLVIDRALNINPERELITLDGIDQSTRLVNINTVGTVSITSVTFVNGGAQGLSLIHI